ncbi:MAG: EamA family transporter RarD [Naasia sp.]|jgi:chloramphenicol-sensitive protein RarD|uniref:EamA family transporter RarD n=1 Tax=Naasia sp. TaxID=2546198 RepID=UPI0026266383|nr:EamA family transporter RarD [Naasia sp.]MCU1569644.1 EamA family transporter RarD [Naasia sp.]
MTEVRRVDETEHASRTGFLAAVAAHLLWGALPLYFLTLAPAGPFEIVAWRIVFSVVVCALLLTVSRSWRRLLGIVRQPRLVIPLAAAAVFVFANWQIFVIASVSGQVVEASLGYFITPIVTVLLGVLVLRERLRPLQWWAVGISGLAVLVLVIGHGTFPFIALGLACSFSVYSLFKKRLGGAVDALSGFAIETAWLTVPSIGILLAVAAGPGLAFGSAGPANLLLLIGVGPMTAVPLLLFATAARRLPLSTLGFVQYVTPVLQFLAGVLLLHEAMPPERWIGFALVWVALVVLSIDLLRTVRRPAVLEPAASF